MKEKFNYILMKLKKWISSLDNEFDQDLDYTENARITSTKLKALSFKQSDCDFLKPPVEDSKVGMHCATKEGIKKARARLTHQRLSALKVD